MLATKYIERQIIISVKKQANNKIKDSQENDFQGTATQLVFR